MPRKALCRAVLVAEKTLPISGAPESQGRWKLNAGSEMIVTVDGLNQNKKGEAQPIRLVLDLAACKPKNPKIHALADHDPDRVIGYWDNFGCSVEGVFADLHVVKPADAIEAEAMPDAVRTRALIREGVPIQVSVGAEAGEGGAWELVDGKVTVNGQEYDGSGDIPLYILRGGELDESSIVTFGADDQTGRLAAKHLTNPVKPETPMSDKLKALLGKFAEKHHGLVARCVAENMDETLITNKVHATEMEDKDKELKAMSDRICALEAENVELKKAKAGQADEEKEEKEVETTATVSASAGAKRTVKFGSSDEAEKKVKAEKVETMTQAMKVVAAKDPNLKGFALRKAARAAFPHAKEA
jgi:hypothetical protein